MIMGSVERKPDLNVVIVECTVQPTGAVKL